VGFVAAAQIGRLDTLGRAKGKRRRKSWFVITSGDPQRYTAAVLLPKGSSSSACFGAWPSAWDVTGWQILNANAPS